jgi:selenocysteine lyase/cysteine desulfurase
MTIHRREFIRNFSLAFGLSAFAGLNDSLFASEIENIEKLQVLPGYDDFSNDDDFWNWISQSYTVSPNIMNLNNGGVSPSPKVVQDTLERYNKLVNEGPSYYMWQIVDMAREPLRKDMAVYAGCKPDEIAFVRNTTEALDNIIFGLSLKSGDEIVLSKQDYPNVINAWKQREKRDGIVLKWVNLLLPSEDEEALVKSYTDLFSEKTKIVNITHIINWIGQILPVNKIAAAAHKRNIEVMVDGAHTFALLDFKIPDLDCDYFGTSLHKWLSAPIGNGLLYIRENKIPQIWPMYPDDNPQSQNIRKFEKMGTRSFPIEMAIGSALDFQYLLGSKRKEERLRYLKNYWMEKVKNIPKVKVHTSLKPEFSCVVGMFAIDGIKPADINSFLFSNYKIHAVSIDWENIHGVRITPHVYTQTRDLDKLVEAISELAKNN